MRTRQRLVVLVAAALVIAGAAVLLLVTTRSKGLAAPRSVGSTAVVTRRDLADTQDVDATLGYADTRPVVAPAAGTVTAVPAAGRMLPSGTVLYSLGGAPVVLLDGSTPAWRTLEEGMASGADVLELERNLVRLGFVSEHEITVDGHFTAATRAAVEALQRRYGLPTTGTIPLGQIVFLPGARIVTSVDVQTGDAVAAGAAVLSTSSTSRAAMVTIDTTERSLLTASRRVDVVLPDSRIVHGRVSSVGTTATPEQGQQDGAAGGGPTPSTINVVVSVDGRVSEPDGTPVTVRVATEVHRDVLSVPVTALIATSGGERSLEIVEPRGRTTIVPVSTGLYAGGYVEVAGVGIHPGVRVLEAPS
jgi:peptidoglycan hydrolase-like protein with peptidoglycan-binding domain